MGGTDPSPWQHVHRRGGKINEEGEDHPLHNLQGRHMTLPFLLYS